MRNSPKIFLWSLLVAMILIVVAALGSGFNRPVMVIVGAGAALMAVVSAYALWSRRAGRSAR